MFKKRVPFGLFVFLSILQSPPHVASESFGGQTATLIPYKNSLLVPEFSIELVNQSKVGLQEKVFRIYVLQPDSKPVDLMGLGYWKVWWRVGNKQGQLQDNLEEEKRKTWNEKPPYTALHSFVAKAKVPKDRNLELEVVIALPGKGGTGMTVFYPFKTASK